MPVVQAVVYIYVYIYIYAESGSFLPSKRIYDSGFVLDDNRVMRDFANQP